jgi:hypothetical protein
VAQRIRRIGLVVLTMVVFGELGACSQSVGPGPVDGGGTACGDATCSSGQVCVIPCCVTYAGDMVTRCPQQPAPFCLIVPGQCGDPRVAECSAACNNPTIVNGSLACPCGGF